MNIISRIWELLPRDRRTLPRDSHHPGYIDYDFGWPVVRPLSSLSNEKLEEIYKRLNGGKVL